MAVFQVMPSANYLSKQRVARSDTSQKKSWCRPLQTGSPVGIRALVRLRFCGSGASNEARAPTTR
jgi:hypothetical protein